MDILATELDRNHQILQREASPPVYFLGYAVADVETTSVMASGGALKSSSSNRTRLLDVTVRGGSPALDNYRVVGGRQPRFTSGHPIPWEDQPAAIRQELWRETDRIYRLASRRLINIQTESRLKLGEQDAPADFSAEDPVTGVHLPPELHVDRLDWERRLRAFSAEFRSFYRIIDSNVSLAATRQVKYLATSEGTRLAHGGTMVRISVTAGAKAADGMEVGAGETFEAFTPGDLPDEVTLRRAIRRVAITVTKLMDAPPVDPYVAPAILSGRAAGVFFHEIFGHRVEGHRLRDASEGQTFRNSVGAPVLPEFLSVLFDPTRMRLGGRDLMGSYDYDDEGVKARPVMVVDKGILRAFLMSRAPADSFQRSNGHGRREPGHEIASRQSNLIVQSSRQATDEELRALLLDEVRKQGKEYGFYFEQVTGGFTQTGRRGIQAFKVIPLVVYRVYPDGRPDELVRGADIVGTPLAAFSKIIAAGAEFEVFNGFCGAESGDVPVAAASPALLVSEIEIQRKESSQDRPPLLPRPVADGGAP